MHISTTDLDVLANRIQRLERENRQIMALAIAAVLVILSVFLMCQLPQDHKMLKATEFVLLDRNGHGAD